MTVHLYDLMYIFRCVETISVMEKLEDKVYPTLHLLKGYWCLGSNSEHVDAIKRCICTYNCFHTSFCINIPNSSGSPSRVFCFRIHFLGNNISHHHYTNSNLKLYFILYYLLLVKLYWHCIYIWHSLPLT